MLFKYSIYFKRKRKIKKECSCLCLSCQHINRPEFYSTALPTTTSVPCILFGVVTWTSHCLISDLKSQKAKFLSQLTLFSCTCDHDSPSIWSPIVVPKQPRPVKLLQRSKIVPIEIYFFFPTLQFQTRIVSTG